MIISKYNKGKRTDIVIKDKQIDVIEENIIRGKVNVRTKLYNLHKKNNKLITLCISLFTICLYLLGYIIYTFIY